MNRIELRGRVAQLCGTRANENDPAQVEMLNLAIDSGLKRITQELPEALSPTEIRTILPAEISPPSGVVMKTTSDPWVLEFYGATSHPAPTDGTGNFIYELWVQSAPANTQSQYARYTCREFWSTAAPDKFYVSLDRPWAEGTAAAGWSDWRLRVPRLYLPAGVIRVVAAQAFGPFWGKVKLEAIESGLEGGEWTWSINDTSVSGYPRTLRRDRAVKLIDPNKAPTYTIEDAVDFGPEPLGEFDYCFTYAQGYRHASEKTPNGNKLPLWESAPSPLLEGVVIPDMHSQAKLILPRIDWQLNFAQTGTLREGKSGYYLRIYRRRRSITGGNNQDIEIGEVFQFLADVDGNAGEFYDDGSIVPDYNLRLPEVHGYYAWDIYPVVRTATEYNVRVRMAPPPLRNDYDAPKIEPNHIETLALFAAKDFALSSQQADHAMLMESEAKKAVARYKENISNTGAVIPGGQWSDAGSYDPLEDYLSRTTAFMR